MIIGIIGKVGSGKSVCTKYVNEKYSAIVFSCDDIAKELITNKEVDYIISDPYEFFTNFKLQDECRKKVHPAVFCRISMNIDNFEANLGIFENNSWKTMTRGFYVIESALPSEMLYNICDKVILIENSYEKKLEILKANRNYTENQVKLIYESQEYYEKFYSMADYKIRNDGTKEELLERIKEVIDEICIICK